MSIILFLVILAVLIAVHEFGHFITAKLSGIRVDEFAIGFPPKLFSWKSGETRYSLNIIPFGGFVKIYGEDPSETPDTGPDQERSFANKPRPVQALVLSAGVLGNVIFAWLILSIALMIGLPAPADYAGEKLLQDPKVTVLGTLPGSPAEKAGLVPGDVIQSISSGKEILPLPFSVDEVRNFIAGNPDQKLSIEIKRGTESKVISVTAIDNIISDRPGIGVSLGSVGILQASGLAAFYEGAKLTLNSVYQVAKGLLLFLKDALQGAANLSQITGPVGIVNLVGEASEFGFAYLLGFTAFISINLAVINLLPFPALDGGRLLFVGIEAIIRRPINARIQNVANLVGFCLLILLMLIVTYQDILRLIK